MTNDHRISQGTVDLTLPVGHGDNDEEKRKLMKQYGNHHENSNRVESSGATATRLVDDRDEENGLMEPLHRYLAREHVRELRQRVDRATMISSSSSSSSRTKPHFIVRQISACFESDQDNNDGVDLAMKQKRYEGNVYSSPRCDDDSKQDYIVDIPADSISSSNDEKSGEDRFDDILLLEDERHDIESTTNVNSMEGARSDILISNNEDMRNLASDLISDSDEKMQIPNLSQWYHRIMSSAWPFGIGLRAMSNFSSDGPRRVSHVRESKDFSVRQDERMLSVVRLETIVLENRLLLPSPTLQMHIVDERTGRYLKKAKAYVASSDATEGLDDAECGNFDKGHDESSLFNHCFVQRKLRCGNISKRTNKLFEYFDEDTAACLAGSNFISRLSERHALLLFEILDVPLNASIDSLYTSTQRSAGELRRVAWGFLRDANIILSSQNPDMNIAQFRLQIHSFVRENRFIRQQTLHRRLFVGDWKVENGVLAPTGEVPSVYIQYIRQRRKLLPCALTFKIGPRSKMERQVYQNETDELHNSRQEVLITSPNVRLDLLHQIECGEFNVTAMRFSQTGRFLACACQGNKTFPLRLYDLLRGELMAEVIVGHHGCVHDIQWCHDDSYIVTASADGTAKIWIVPNLDQAVEEQKAPVSRTEIADEDEHKGVRSQKKFLRKETFPLQNTCIFMHPQPAEVYCTQVIRQRMEDSAAALVFTGSSDCGIRLWTSTLSSQDIGLLGDKIHHERSVVSLCLDNQTKRLFSGDAGGVILVWGCRRRDVIRSGTDFVVLRTIDNLNGVKSWPITGLCLNRTVLSDGVRHLLSLTPNGIKMIDLSTYQLSPVTFEENDLRFMMKGAAFIEGGRFIVGGTSEGRVQVWDSICGQHIATPFDSAIRRPLSIVCGNVRDGMVGLASPSGNNSILIYKLIGLLDEPRKPFRGESTSSSRQIRGSFLEPEKQERYLHLKEKTMAMAKLTQHAVNNEF